MTSYRIPFDVLENFSRDVLIKIGVEPQHAAVVADILTESDRRGHETHGIGRLKPIYYDRVKKGILETAVKYDIVKETSTTAVIDAHNSLGHPISKIAMQMAIDKAKQHGLGMVVCRNSTHYGIAGYYTSMAAAQGCVGMCGTNARPSIPPTGAVENMLGTNPLAFAFPTDEDFDFNLDCATSIAQRGRIEQYVRENRPVPAGWVIDDKGQPCSDAQQVLTGLTKGTHALLPLGGAGEELGGYKGYGYATVVEVLSASLSQANFLRALYGTKPDGSAGPIELGHFFFAANVEAFTTLEEFKKSAGDIMRELRTAKKAHPEDRIYVAGEKECEAYHEQIKLGGVIIEPANQKAIDAMRAEQGLTQYVFPWDAKQDVPITMTEEKPNLKVCKYPEGAVQNMCLDKSMYVGDGCYHACSCHVRK
ncbi:putative Malate dehydrogenase [Blattamonas nauphoetae]|uniref:Malate dehydrogenase n=1 Tax=Blattamonas nauphoetae TaxID=2049346 RepID=A0ABQ9YGA5_9EUKA|nr:putative Malate dehydrogenase [Blattamonas nauphoetae]